MKKLYPGIVYSSKINEEKHKKGRCTRRDNNRKVWKQRVMQVIEERKESRNMEGNLLCILYTKEGEASREGCYCNIRAEKMVKWLCPQVIVLIHCIFLIFIFL